MKLKIPLKVWQQMQCYATLSSPSEITGIGTIILTNNEFVVDRIFIPKQITNPGYCESAKGAMNEIIFNLVEDDPTRVGDLRFRWHSHANGSVFWSATDKKDIDSWQGPWVVNLVMNVFGEYLARLDTFHHDMRLANIPLEIEILTSIPTDIIEHCEQEIKKKVKRMVYRPVVDLKPNVLTAYAQAAQNFMKGGENHETE